MSVRRDRGDEARGQFDRVEVADRVEIAMLLVVAVLLSAYAALRYRGLWGEGDTSVFTNAIRAMLGTGLLAPGDGQVIYPNGYGFQALAVFLIDLGGVGLSTFQLYGAALLMPWMVIPAWLLYREMIGSSRGATVATAILFVQPEFLFPILRGTHEKFTRGLMLCCLFLLLRSLRSRQKPAVFGGLIFAFYLSAFALIAFNNLLGSSFIAATALALVLGWLAWRVVGDPLQSAGPVFRRLLYATGTSMTIAVLFTVYVYRPAQHDLYVLQSVWDRLAALLLYTRTSASNPYAVVSIGWISLPVYFTVSIANWLLLAGSFSIWAWQGVTWLRRRWQPRERNELLLWAFYGAFAFMGVLSVVVDVSGALTSNLQQRIFPSFAMVATPVVAKWILEQQERSALSPRLIQGALWSTIGVLAILSTFKATNEPLLSNKWLFYQPSEMSAVGWASQNLAGRTLWVAFDERISTALQIRGEERALKIGLDEGNAAPDTRDFLISNVTRAQALRINQPLPIGADDSITFDDGQAQIYHLRARTPYQR